MIFPTVYNCLSKNEYSDGVFKIVPIRYEDRLTIMRWRNEQIYHLRQDKPLTVKSQEDYFNGTVARLFDQEKPSQILFSYLKNGMCIGYGGLVHINWIDKNAEISFVLNTELEKEQFEYHWLNYLKLIDQLAFEELQFHKIFVYAFDLRPHLYQAIEKGGFTKEAVLKEHCLYDNKFIDVVIHSKININNNIYLRPIHKNDMELLFEFVNDESVRNNAINQTKITWSQHKNWFNDKINSKESFIYILMHKNVSVGQIRIDKDKEGLWVIDYSITKENRGKGLGKILIKKLLNIKNNFKYKAVVRKDNLASNYIFKTLNFKLISTKDKFNTYYYGL